MFWLNFLTTKNWFFDFCGTNLCGVVTKEPSVGIFISKKIHFYKAVQNFQKYFFHVNLLRNIVYYVYIDLYIHTYTPNQAICIPKLFKKFA